MSTIAMDVVNVRRVEPGVDPLEADMAQARKIATLLDSQFSVGGFRFGIDGIVGLLPVAGDVVTTAMGSYLLYIAHKHKLGTGVKARMAGNLLLDWLVGLIPLLGDLFDLVFKANKRNMTILERAVAKRRPAKGTITVA